VVEKVAILGAGLMGARIAQVTAQGGYHVILRDLQMGLVQEGLRTIEKNLDQMVLQGQISCDNKAEILKKISGTTDLSEVRIADLVIEAVVENMAIKKQIFAELDNLCPPHTILATNTSSLSISEIAAATKRQGKILGIHFFNPVVNNRLVELVRGLETSDDTVEMAVEFVKTIGKDYVIVNRESPGFIVNRILMSYINEAIFLYCEGAASPEVIDQALKLRLGLNQGPLELADNIGLDIIYNTLDSFYNEYKDPKYRVHPFFATMIKAGYYGKKSGKGFYIY